MQPLPIVIAVLAWASVAAVAAPPSTAQPACPRAVETGRGIELATTGGGRTAVLTWLDAERVRIAELSPSSPRSFPRETIAVRGLIGVDLSWPGSKVRLEFAAPLGALFPLVPGRQHELDYVAAREGRPPLKGRMTLAVIEPLQHTVGVCTYDALLIGSVSTFEDGTQSPMRYDVYVPALHAVVKSTMFAVETHALLEQETFEFDSIAAR
jgi:hypothetical protein